MDKVQFGQVLSNLFRNATEATTGAPASLGVVSTYLIGCMRILRKVSDDGSGLADAVRKSLFELLTSTKATGMGVGLSISKSIIEARYGRIWSEARPGGGAVFTFTLPLATAESVE
jgi:two-component system, LuxR family, sensor kinase FixL